MVNKIEIMEGKKSDIRKLLELDKEANKEIKWWSPISASEFSKLIKKKNLIYIAEQDKKIIGYLNGNLKEKQLLLEDIYIKRNYRNKGIAKKLIQKFISDQKKSRFKEIRIDCPERLRKFYEKFGFKTTAIIMKRKIK